MTKNTPRPLVLLILDGWGCAAPSSGNAVDLAATPELDRLLNEYPNTQLLSSGRAVGLPDGYMGNSEVGHMNIGAGRVVYQDMTRIDISIEEGRFASNEAFQSAFSAVQESGGKLHFMGLVSDGGVHSHQNHIHALLQMAKDKGLEDVFVHAFLDGRDTPPTSGYGYVEALESKMDEIGLGKVALVSGRYYAMDRDKRWDRNELAYKAIVSGEGPTASSALECIQKSYAQDINDEFVKPCVIVDAEGNPLAPVEDGDAIIFFNFRADRARQICRAFFDPQFTEFERARVPELAAFVTMTRYEADFPMPVAFPPQSITNCLGEVLSEHGLRQLRIAETEKYAHVTYFLNGGREEPFEGEDRELVASPRDVATYDLKPAMSAREVTDKLVGVLDDYDVVVCNLANLDMVGHTGIIPAVCDACGVVDGCVKDIVSEVLERDGLIFLTADHGNAEEMLDANGNPQTAHSKNPVPFVVISKSAGSFVLREGGRLGDISPTILSVLGLKQPEEMTGQSLLDGGE